MALCNRIVAAIIFSLLTITTPSILAYGQSNQSFDRLLEAYSKAKFQYKLASVINNDSEMAYWENQCFFYQSKISEILIDTDQDARKDPHGLCLQALKMYSKYINTSGGIVGPIYDSLLYFNMRNNLADYCARYGIFYNPYEEKM